MMLVSELSSRAGVSPVDFPMLAAAVMSVGFGVV
jgi:hypothetical protein